MSYSQGGLIEAVDYNNFLNGSNQLNTVWGTGAGATGYGQTALTTVTIGSVITATQWATLINTLNSIATHQTGSGSGIAAVSAGQQIDYLSTLQTQMGNIYTNRASYASQGNTTVGSNFDAAVSSTTGLSNYTVDRIVTFSSAQHARYFFNTGGQLKFRCEAINSADTGSENSFGRLVTGIGGVDFNATTNGGRTGSGITLNTNLTSHGYYNNGFNSPTTIVQVTDSTSSYTGSTAFLQCYYGGSNDTTNGARGSVLVFRTIFTVGDKTWDDTLSLTYRTRVDITYPETNYLTDVWGTPVVS